MEDGCLISQQHDPAANEPPWASLFGASCCYYLSLGLSSSWCMTLLSFVDPNIMDENSGFIHATEKGIAQGIEQS